MLIARGSAATATMPLLRWVVWAFVAKLNVSPDLKRMYFAPAASRIWHVTVRILHRETRFWDWKFARDGYEGTVLGVMRTRRSDAGRHYSIIITADRLGDPVRLISTFIHEYVHAVQFASQQLRWEFGEKTPRDIDEYERQAYLAQQVFFDRVGALALSTGFGSARALIEHRFGVLTARSPVLAALVEAARQRGGCATWARRSCPSSRVVIRQSR